MLWDKNVAFCFVRPTRHTFEFMNKSETYTLSFFDERYRSVLAYGGMKLFQERVAFIGRASKGSCWTRAYVPSGPSLLNVGSQ